MQGDLKPDLRSPPTRVDAAVANERNIRLSPVASSIEAVVMHAALVVDAAVDDTFEVGWSHSWELVDYCVAVDILT
jgi:hypothetical protein